MKDIFLQIGLSAGIPIILGLFARFTPKDKVTGFLERLDAKIAVWVDSVITRALGKPVYMAGVGLSKLLASKLGKKLGEKVEEGLIKTVVQWINDIVKIFTNRLIELIRAIQTVPDAFMKGVLSDNAKKRSEK